MNKWKIIWNKNERIEKIILEMLMKADGFDSGAGAFEVDDWINYTSNFYNKLDIKENDTIFDVGCGSGAFLYPLYLKNYKVGGVDYSMELINLANKIMPEASFEVKEAIEIDDKKYDFVVSHSVFHYFPSLDYAERVIEKMVKKSNKKIGIFDINDKGKETIYHRIRMGNMSEEEYSNKYKGLEHMFYDKVWFQSIAEKLNLKITIFNQTFEKYTNSKLRFNVIMEKK